MPSARARELLRGWRRAPPLAVAAALASGVDAAPQTLFTNEAAARGVDYVVTQGAFSLGQFGCGVVAADLDGDGDADLVLCGNDSDTLGIFANDGSGHFTDVSASAGIPPLSMPSGLVAGDYDADGDLDLFLTRWLEAAVLLRNDGALHFTDVTTAAGLANQSGAGGGCAFGDYDGDGWIDLAVANRYGTAASFVPNRLFRNLGDGTFADVAARLGLENNWPAFQCSFVDVDRDDDLDLYVSNDKGAFNPRWNRLYRNNGDGTFVDDSGCGADVHADAMGNAVGDVDGDGFPELYVPNIPAGNILLTSDDGGATFVDVAATAGVEAFAVCWGSAFFDGENDGDLDLLTVALAPAPNFYFMRDGAWPMLDRTLVSGLGDLESSYCIALADLDDDGDLDLVVQDWQAPIRLYINHADAIASRTWVKLVAQGRGANSHSIGCTVDAWSGGVWQWRDVAAGTAYKSQSSYVMHLGLGTATELDELHVRFPRAGSLPAATRVLTNLPALATWPLWPPERLGDENGDGVWSAAEFDSLESLVGTPFEPAAAIFDFDGDSDVDPADAAQFRERQCDLDADGAVGASDLALLLDAWGSAMPDFDGDEVVGPGELAILLGSWSETERDDSRNRAR